MEDILRQLRENPDRLPVVALPPSRPANESLSPNRCDSISMDVAPEISNEVAQTLQHQSSTAATLSPPFHSRSTSLDGDIVCPPLSQPEVVAQLPPVPDAEPTPNPQLCPPTVTVDGATPPIGAIVAPPLFPQQPVSVPATASYQTTAVELSESIITEPMEPPEASRVLN